MVFIFASNFEFSTATMSMPVPCPSVGALDAAGLSVAVGVLDSAGLLTAVGGGLRYRLALRGLRYRNIGKRAEQT